LLRVHLLRSSSLRVHLLRSSSLRVHLLRGSSLRVHRLRSLPRGIAQRVFHGVHRFAFICCAVHRCAVHRFAFIASRSSLRVHRCAVYPVE
jgi:hypothetical protein